MNLYSDDAIRADIVALTAAFRFRICWDGTRQLLRDRGIDPMRCLLLSCDQGDDVNGLLTLPDGQLVEFGCARKPHGSRPRTVHQLDARRLLGSRIRYRPARFSHRKASLTSIRRCSNTSIANGAIEMLHCLRLTEFGRKRSPNNVWPLSCGIHAANAFLLHSTRALVV